MVDDSVKQNIAAVVAAYKRLTPSQRHALNEEKTKVDYILTLFEALGWDRRAEIFPEESVSRKRVDYAFKVNDVTQFFLEAKSPSVNINEERWAKQAIEYAVNRGVTWAVLTNFERLHVFWALGYDPRASATRLDRLLWKSLSCTEYVEQADQLWLLSKESFRTGLTLEAARRDRLPPAVTVEKRLFERLRVYRERLWNWLGAGQDRLPDPFIDEVIQQLFSRLIFIRNCEDRGLEEHQLRAAVEHFHKGGRGSSLLPALRKVFAYYREHYDSELFPEQGHLLDDPQRVHIDDSTLADIITDLYRMPGGYADYDFSLIDADVLGQVYEQYLGHVAVKQKERLKAIETARQTREAARREGTQVALLDDMDTVAIVEKKAKRKEQGIYYTPQWVVDYIVKQTVRRSVAEAGSAKGAKEQRLNDTRILDPACGSGSFLIRAYDELLRLHAELEGRDPTTFFDEGALWLKRNIYGVDLDPQAVYIARLNLMVRALAKRQRLPELRDNVQKGNSLISGNEAELRPYFGDDWESKRPFDWAERFPEVMAEGGFDVVIGNPPYVRTQSLPREDADYYRARYQSAHGSFDIYVMFIERSLQLLKPGGRLGFITSGKFLKAEYGKKLQQLLGKEATVETMVDLSAHQVFAEATNYPVVLVLRKGQQNKALRYAFLHEAVGSAPEVEEAVRASAIEAPQSALAQGVWPPRTSDKSGALLRRLENAGTPLLDIPAMMSRGSSTGRDDVFCLIDVNGELRTRTGGPVDIERNILRRPLYATDFTRYQLRPRNNETIIFPYSITQDGYELIPESLLRERFPKTYAYLYSRRDLLQQRKQHKQWYGYSAPRNLHIHEHAHILVPLLANRGLCAPMPLERGQFCVMASAGFSISLKTPDRRADRLYALGLVNSKLLFWHLSQMSNRFRGGWVTCTKQYFGKLPIRQIDPASKTDVALRDRIVALVERMLQLKERIAARGEARDSEREELEREAERTDRQIDRAVYELYGLTRAEVALVEEKP